MKYSILGNTTSKISRICLGTMTWGHQNTELEAFEQMDFALSKGVNFWDTAEMYPVPPNANSYGKTEIIIGNWLASRKQRDEVFLATKISPISWARNEKSPSINSENIKLAVNNSLKRLKTDYIDLFQLHWVTNRPNYHFANWWEYEPPENNKSKNQICENIVEILNTCDGLIKEGKIKHIGLSNDSAWGINQFCRLSEKFNLPRIVSVQNEYNLLRRRDEHDVMETCSLEGISYLSWSPLQMGVLSGKYLEGIPLKGTRFSKEWDPHGRYAPRINPKVQLAVQHYLEIAKKFRLDLCQLSIAFTLRKKYMSSSIVGATSLEQLNNNINSIELNLNKEILEQIELVRKEFPVPF